MAISAALTALGGTFYAQYVLFIDPESVFPLSLSILICLVAVLGGVGTLWGPVLGAAVLVPLAEGTRVHARRHRQGARPRHLRRADHDRLGGSAGGIMALLQRGSPRAHDQPPARCPGVTKRFGGLVANREISFEVGPGELVGVIGPNGAGKSTLFDLITGFQPPDAGHVRLDGHRRHRAAARRDQPARRRPDVPEAQAVRAA